jgi:hypothetical protein
LVVATFGRGFYVLDDYSALREAKPETLEKPAALFPVRDGFLFMQTSQFGGRGKAFLGEAFYAADNPPFGALIDYHLKEALPTKKQKRKEAAKKGNPPYPSLEELRAEAEEEEPAILLTIENASGKPIRVITGPASAGMHRVTWDLRLPAASLPAPRPMGAPDEDFFGPPPGGPLVTPGRYKVTLSKRVEGVVTQLAGPVDIVVKYVGQQGLPAEDLKVLAEFQASVIKLQRDLTTATSAANDLTAKLAQIKLAFDQTPAAPAEAREKVRKTIAATREIVKALSGDSFLRSRNENAPASIAERVGEAAAATRTAISKPTGTQKEQFKIAREELDQESAKIRKIIETDVKEYETLLNKLGAPYTPGRLPGGKVK